MVLPTVALPDVAAEGAITALDFPSRLRSLPSPRKAARNGRGRQGVQWILQKFEDTAKLGDALARLGLPHTWHKVVPFVGELLPEPDVPDPNAVVLFGSYSL